MLIRQDNCPQASRYWWQVVNGIHSYPSVQAQACLSTKTTACRPAATGGKLSMASILTHLPKPKHAYLLGQLPAGQPLLVASCRWQRSDIDGCL
jgi:hypothetical protein